jgi:isochorismate pyruvate lyase
MVGVMSRELPSNERSLAPFRAEIDRIDAEIVVLLARRLEVVKHVIAVKRSEGLAALLPERVEDVVEKVSGSVESGPLFRAGVITLDLLRFRKH